MVILWLCVILAVVKASFVLQDLDHTYRYLQEANIAHDCFERTESVGMTPIEIITEELREESRAADDYNLLINGQFKAFMKLNSIEYCESSDSSLMSLQMQLADPNSEETLVMTEIGVRGVDSECNFWSIENPDSAIVTSITMYYSELEFIEGLAIVINDEISYTFGMVN